MQNACWGDPKSPGTHDEKHLRFHLRQIFVDSYVCCSFHNLLHSEYEKTPAYTDVSKGVKLSSFSDQPFQGIDTPDAGVIRVRIIIQRKDKLGVVIIDPLQGAQCALQGVFVPYRCCHLNIYRTFLLCNSYFCILTNKKRTGMKHCTLFIGIIWFWSDSAKLGQNRSACYRSQTYWFRATFQPGFSPIFSPILGFHPYFTQKKRVKSGQNVSNQDKRKNPENVVFPGFDVPISAWRTGAHDGQP